MHRGTQAYFQTQAATTNQGEVVIMLFDGAIKFLNRAKDQLTAKDYAAKGNLISKALDILNELDSTLNREKGGDLAQNLHQLYFLCSSKLLRANLKLDSALIDEVLLVLHGLRDAFVQIANTPEAMAAAEEAALTNATWAASRRSLPKSSAIGYSPEAEKRIASMYASPPERKKTTTLQHKTTENNSAIVPKTTPQTEIQAYTAKIAVVIPVTSLNTEPKTIANRISSKKTASIYQQTVTTSRK